MELQKLYEIAVNTMNTIKASGGDLVAFENSSVCVIYTDREHIFTGFNGTKIENGAIKNTCAEYNTISSMMIARENRILKIITVSFKTNEVIELCEDCQKLMCEINPENRLCEVAISKTKTVTLESLMAKSLKNNTTVDSIENNFGFVPADSSENSMNVALANDYVTSVSADESNPFYEAPSKKQEPVSYTAPMPTSNSNLYSGQQNNFSQPMYAQQSALYANQSVAPAPQAPNYYNNNMYVNQVPPVQDNQYYNNYMQQPIYPYPTANGNMMYNTAPQGQQTMNNGNGMYFDAMQSDNPLSVAQPYQTQQTNSWYIPVDNTTYSTQPNVVQPQANDNSNPNVVTPSQVPPTEQQQQIATPIQPNSLQNTVPSQNIAQPTVSESPQVITPSQMNIPPQNIRPTQSIGQISHHLGSVSQSVNVSQSVTLSSEDGSSIYKQRLSELLGSGSIPSTHTAPPSISEDSKSVSKSEMLKMAKENKKLAKIDAKFAKKIKRKGL